MKYIKDITFYNRNIIDDTCILFYWPLPGGYLGNEQYYKLENIYFEKFPEIIKIAIDEYSYFLKGYSILKKLGAGHNIEFYPSIYYNYINTFFNCVNLDFSNLSFNYDATVCAMRTGKTNELAFNNCKNLIPTMPYDLNNFSLIYLSTNSASFYYSFSALSYDGADVLHCNNFRLYNIFKKGGSHPDYLDNKLKFPYLESIYAMFYKHQLEIDYIIFLLMMKIIM